MKAFRSIFPALLALASVAAHAAIPVTVAPLAEQLVDLELRAPAMVVPGNKALVTAQVSALVIEIGADVGASVSRGDLLVRLDDRDAQLGLARARADRDALQARVEQAGLQLRRGEELVADDYISDDELIERRTQVKVLAANLAAQELQVKSAELILDRCTVTAPYDAVVLSRTAQVGNLAQPGSPLLTIVQSQNREVDADVDPRFADGLANARKLRFESRGQSWPLQLARLSAVIDSDSRVQKARFRFDAEPATVGASGEVVWQEASGLVPVPLIVQRADRLGVFIAEDGKARFVPLPSAQEGRPARADLPADTSVVIRGQARLQDGDDIQTSQP